MTLSFVIIVMCHDLWNRTVGTIPIVRKGRAEKWREMREKWLRTAEKGLRSEEKRGRMMAVEGAAVMLETGY